MDWFCTAFPHNDGLSVWVYFLITNSNLISNVPNRWLRFPRHLSTISYKHSPGRMPSRSFLNPASLTLAVFFMIGESVVLEIRLPPPPPWTYTKLRPLRVSETHLALWLWGLTMDLTNQLTWLMAQGNRAARSRESVELVTCSSQVSGISATFWRANALSTTTSWCMRYNAAW